MLNRFDSIFVVLLLWTVYAETEKVDAPPVSLGLYYESLCPYCRQFIVGQLWPTYSHLSVVMNLTLVPFGNAQVTKDGDKWKFTCQHGPNECYSNIVQTCGLFYITSTKTSLNFIQCISAADEPWQAGEKVHTEEIQDQAQNDLFDLICETYKGEKPSACNVTKRKPYTSNHV
ncbi:gamma-interferon-inducible lysosomal thiol reductase-like isoform X2 [Limulus polyphemus]|uniref:Gamma-interferon-inducible lysosomal thiol reductase-like isoform X2 n=1 Tax=Limulus polyphemus TaxID=6850 RepID=A0ABM1T722_LIMPO|nr:gamma-interferon-inducible lysosomal thiol reductase-like isoform X2 [Limulus polyphemus]